MNYLYITLFFFLIASCSSEVRKEEKSVSTENTKTTAETSSNNQSNPIPESVVPFSYFTGTLGLYDGQVLMELQITDSTFTGGYWYAKHQKRIELSGHYDPRLDIYLVKESYKDKHTGNFEFQMVNDTLQGHWYAPGKDSESESFLASAVVKDVEKPIQPVFATYEMKHPITIYMGEEEGNVKEEATDDCIVTRLNDIVLFSYSVIGINAHTGNIDGQATVKDGKAIYNGENSCQLQLTFNETSLDIEELGDCSYYRGARAYFGGTLKKVK
jgi:hypothetical protein